MAFARRLKGNPLVSWPASILAVYLIASAGFAAQGLWDWAKPLPFVLGYAIGIFLLMLAKAIETIKARKP